jgi:glycosyltransferase involved in cell wall biosynthesis
MKNKLTEVVWWESCITEHQVHTLNELSLLPDVMFRAFVLKHENNGRKKQGWNECDLSQIDAKIIPFFSSFFILKTLKHKRKCVHVFAGPFDSLSLTLGLFFSLLMNNRTYVLTEPYSPIGAELLNNGSAFKSMVLKTLRPLKYNVLWKLIRKNIEGVFAISPLAIKQLILFGVNKNKILPYAYFVPSTIPKTTSNITKSSFSPVKSLKIIFVGSLNYRKGLDIAIQALNKVNNDLNVILDIFGPGEIKVYPKLVNINYKGIIPFGRSQEEISKYDILLLPSRFDGWGVVVNEALLAGIPVICSNEVGAAGLVKKWHCGMTYDSRNVNSLVNLLVEFYNNKNLFLKEFREDVKCVQKIISPRNGAEYVINAIKSTQLNNVPQKNEWYERD